MLSVVANRGVGDAGDEVHRVALCECSRRCGKREDFGDGEGARAGEPSADHDEFVEGGGRALLARVADGGVHEGSVVPADGENEFGGVVRHFRSAFLEESVEDEAALDFANCGFEWLGRGERVEAFECGGFGFDAWVVEVDEIGFGDFGCRSGTERLWKDGGAFSG